MGSEKQSATGLAMKLPRPFFLALRFWPMAASRTFHQKKIPARHLFPCAFAAVLGAGCSLPSGFTGNSAPLPADWKNAGKFPVAAPSGDLTRWWSRFEDPTLSRIIADGLRNNPDLASASARVREARALRNAEASLLYPSLGGSGSVRAISSEILRGSGTNTTSSSAGLDASWEIDLFGKNRSRVEAASAQYGAAQENFHSAQASLASEIAIAYTILRANEAALGVLQRTVTTREETSKLATWRTQTGVTDSLESSQAISSLEQARAAVPSRQQSIAQSRNLIALLAGQPPGTLDGLLSSGRNSIPYPANSLAIGIPADTVRKRPDVRISGYQLLAAAARTRAAKAELYPSLNLTGSLGLNTLGSGKVFDPQSTSAGMAAGITSPIFNAGRIRSNIDAQDAAEEQAWNGYRSTVLTALSEVEDSLIACERTAERLAILEKATSAAREAATLAQQQYEAGVADILTVLDSQSTLLGLEESLLTVRASRTIAFIQLYKALGGGWSPES
jgi:NodT family efflux transporter outer membrane factor (OMF) lipoprotein